MRQGTLAEYVGIEGPSLVRLLDQLCAAGLARRDEDPHDRRAKTISLTAAGRAVTAKMEEDLRTLRAQVLKVSRAPISKRRCACSTHSMRPSRTRPPHARLPPATPRHDLSEPSRLAVLGKTFAASMLALYLGLYFQLPRPYWAMASVYIVSNPFVGATRSKALYRALGTALGAAAAIFFVPPFVETPLLFAIIVATWCGTLLYLAISDRTARSYVFMLAGYTMPLVALPTVTDPSTVFDVAIARTEEIVLGIVCASVVGSAIFPNRLAPTLIERTDAWFKDAAFYGRETLSGHIAGKALSACRQRLAATITGLEFLLSQLSYDHAHPRILARAQALAGRMQLFLPLMSSLADPLIALMRDLHIRPAGRRVARRCRDMVRRAAAGRPPAPTAT